MGYSGGWRGDVGRRIGAFLNRRPLVGGLLFLVVGAVLVGSALVEDHRTFSGPDPTAGDVPGTLAFSFAGGAGVVVLLVGARALVLLTHRRWSRSRRDD